MLVRMLKNTDQKNPEYGHFLRSVYFLAFHFIPEDFYSENLISKANIAYGSVPDKKVPLSLPPENVRKPKAF